MLIDNHGRPLNYLRLAVTDRCNLRCLYCMPENGLDWVARKELLSFEEIIRMLRLFSSLGINKLRLTGGEPFLRKDLMDLLRQIHSEKLFTTLSITTNGTLTLPHVDELRKMNVHSINLSADTFDSARFEKMTRRPFMPEVRATFDALLAAGIPTRLNAVIMDGKNEQDIAELAALTLHHPVGVRFIEEMPFNGAGDRHAIRWNWKAIHQELQNHFPSLEKILDEPHSTSLNYKIPGSVGHIGIIPAYTRSFCGTCNRIRLTPKGTMKTCLYDNGVLDLKHFLRGGASDESIRSLIVSALSHRAKDGFEAEQNRHGQPVNESMASIGG